MKKFFIVKAVACEWYATQHVEWQYGGLLGAYEYHLNPAISEGFVRLLYPDKPRHSRQKYLFTAKELARYDEINKTKK